MNFTKYGTNGDANMGAIRYALKDGQYVLADGCNITEADGVEELDCSVRLYKLLQQNGYDTIGQVTAKPGMVYFEMDQMNMKALKELLVRLDFLGFRLADWPREQTVEEYFSIYQAADRHRFAEEMALLEEEDWAERRERARIRARERRTRLRAASNPKNNQTPLS